MSQKVLKRYSRFGTAIARASDAIDAREKPVPITTPPSEPAAIQEDGNSFTLDSFTYQDAIELGHFLYARLLPFAPQRPALISISLANSSQILFQTVTGPGLTLDNEHWVRRKRNTVLRFGQSSWFMNRRFDGDEAGFASKYGISPEKAGEYSIHGGAIPLRVKGVEGIVAVVVVSGLRQNEDHGVITEVIKEHWREEEFNCGCNNKRNKKTVTFQIP